MKKIFKVVLFILMILVMFSCSKQEEGPNENEIIISNVSVAWADIETMRMTFDVKNIGDGKRDVSFKIIYTATTSGRDKTRETGYYRLASGERKTIAINTVVGSNFVGRYSLRLNDIKEISYERPRREVDLDHLVDRVYWDYRVWRFNRGGLIWDF